MTVYAYASPEYKSGLILTLQDQREKHKTHIRRNERSESPFFRVEVELADGRTDQPIQYKDGSIAYNFPQAMTKRTRRIVAHMYDVEIPALLKRYLLDA